MISTSALFALAVAAQSAGGPASSVPQAPYGPPPSHVETKPISDSWQAKIRSAQVEVQQKQAALQQAIMSCDECLMAQAALNASLRSANRVAEDAAKDSKCMGRLGQDLTCQIQVNTPVSQLKR
jgi:hypothetical protein